MSTTQLFQTYAVLRRESGRFSVSSSCIIDISYMCFIRFNVNFYCCNFTEEFCAVLCFGRDRFLLKTHVEGFVNQLCVNLSIQNREYNNVLSEKQKNNTAYSQITTQDVAYAEELKQVNAKRKKVKEQLKQEENKLANAEAVPEKNKKEIEELKGVLEKLNKQRTKEQEEVSKVLASLQEETLELQENKDKLQTRLSELKNVVDQARSKHDLAESELKIYLSNEQKEKSKLEQLKATLSKTSDKLKERRAALDELNRKLPGAREELESAQQELREVREEEANSAQDLNRRRTNLEERRVAMNANKSRNRVLDFLLTQKQEGHIPGIYGRLGDLGAIDGKYDVAVSTACGPLDNIVVDSVQTGEKCVAALKRHNVGRATFIALDKQEYLRNVYTKPFQAPENVPRLFDLIKVADDRVRPAFYYAIRDTLVANDLDQATRIAYGRVRHRVVTLKGELIEVYGLSKVSRKLRWLERVTSCPCRVCSSSAPGAGHCIVCARSALGFGTNTHDLHYINYTFGVIGGINLQTSQHTELLNNADISK
ncbi:Structural maintenance of chromosomes protein 4 [Homalodisca vitripennis]|nr:Structural maintenance of chromosomes protein 4 [Homalodisca vitripennis]